MAKWPLLATFLALATIPAAARADDDHDLAQQLSNPVSSLISVPFQYNYDCCFGPEDAGHHTLNIQPVVPISLGDDWNLIVRTILPVVYFEGAVAGADDEFGLSDTLQSFFFVPAHKPGEMIVGFGPAILWPTGTDEALGSEKWGAGPTLVVVQQQHGWTFGLLANHIWSFAGAQDRQDVSNTFLQPFVSYAFPDTTTLLLNTESTYDWVNEQWTVPINAGISKIFDVGGQKISLGMQGKVYAEAPDQGPSAGLRLIATFLFPE